MAEVQFPSNTQHGKKETSEEKNISQVTVTPPKLQKKPIGKRLQNALTGEDSKTVFQYVLMSVVVPATKDLIVDVVTQAIERFMYGASRPAKRRGGTYSSGYSSSYVNYSGSSRSRSRDRENNTSERSHQNSEELVYGSRVEADEVLNKMSLLIEAYEVATVSDLYQLAGVSSSFVDQKWGWTDLSMARIVKVRDGYIIDKPSPEYLN